MLRAREAWLPPLVYAALTLAIAGPLLAPGYVFALDHAMGPRSADYYSAYLAHNEDAIQSKGGYALLLLALDAALPTWAAQKLLLFVPFLLAGWGAHRLARRHASEPAAYFGGLLYALSPFVYLRAVAGQSGVVWSYALAPWFFAAWLAYVESGRRRDLVPAVLLIAATALFQAHGVVLLAALVGAHALVRLAREPAAWRATLRAPLALAGWSLLVNAAWLLPIALAERTTLSAIGDADRAFFATTDAGLPGVGLAALTLQGFWRDVYRSPFEHPALLLVPAAVLLLTTRGMFRRRDDATWTLAIVGLAGLLLAVGSGSRATAWLFDPLWEHVPILRGFRDAHKLLALLALAYAAIAPVGVDALIESVRSSRGRVALPAIVAILLVVPLAGASPLLGGYGGQLRVADYPAGWGEVEMATRDCDGAMLALPWHLYLDLGFVPQPDKRVTNPAKLYFTCPTITSDNLELGDAASQASTPQVAYADHWMTSARFASGNPRNITTLGNLLAPLGVRYVVLLKESDWRTLAPDLDAQRDLRLVVDNEDARLYENLAASAPVWRTERTVPIGSWDELLPLSETMPLAGVALPLSGDSAPSSGDARPAEAHPDGLGWRVDPAPGRLLVAAPHPRAPATSWRFDGAPPTFLSLGFAPVFEREGGGAVSDAAAWRVALPAWGISVVALIALTAGTRTDLHLIWGKLRDKVRP